MVTSANLNAYEDSADADVDVARFRSLVDEMQELVNKPELEDWLKATNQNFGGTTLQILWNLRAQVEGVDRSWERIETQLIELSQ